MQPLWIRTVIYVLILALVVTSLITGVSFLF
ncbi:stressosome-associated protein Prli42 [Kroppenstedtia pulmonis]|uniref:Stressosome-associated protein Prli42 n=1 Tax=Kroppenstedtia pulmonis TaxID=1380685 RepID=A0A7D4B297_9BACL|nr:stressosome-associated protein Prli42 [Kroppenstedtia pulmonis]